MKVIRERILNAVHKCLQWEDGEITGIEMLKLEQHIDGILAQLQQHGVMQAEGSGVSEGAAVGNSAAGKGVCDGCGNYELQCSCYQNSKDEFYKQ